MRFDWLLPSEKQWSPYPTPKQRIHLTRDLDGESIRADDDIEVVNSGYTIKAKCAP